MGQGGVPAQPRDGPAGAPVRPRLLGHPFDAAPYRAGAEDIVVYTVEHPDSPDSQTQANWLAAVRMALVAGRPARASEWLGQAPPLKAHKAEADVLGGVASAATAENAKLPLRAPALLAKLDKLFGKVRSPKWRGSAKAFDEPDEQRLELGIIRYRYFAAKDGAIDWDAVIESIRR